MYCPTCGFFNEGPAVICRACGGPLSIRQPLPNPLPVFPQEAAPQHLAPEGHTLPSQHPTQPASRSYTVSALAETAPAAVGKVIVVEPLWYEPQPIAWPIVALRSALLVEILAIPGIVIWGLLARFGTFSTLLGAVGILLLLQFFMPVNLLSLLGILRLLNPWRRNPQQIPVRSFRLRTSDGREIAVVARGRLHGTVPMAGDALAIWGRIRLGTLFLKRAVNLQTGATTVCSPAGSRISLAAHLVSALVLTLLLSVLILAVATGGRAG